VKFRRSAGVMAPASLVSIKSYLIAQTAESLWVFNTTAIARCDSFVAPQTARIYLANPALGELLPWTLTVHARDD